MYLAQALQETVPIEEGRVTRSAEDILVEED